MKSNNDTGSKGASSPVTIEYSTNSQKITADYDLLIIACDPRNLTKVCDFTNAELAIFSQFQNFTFHTTLMTVPITAIQQHGVIFDPSALDKMDGSVYGFRNESAKKFGLNVSNTMTENLVTVYQLQGVTTKPLSPDEFFEILRAQLRTIPWWPFGTTYTIHDAVTTPYFDHFAQSNLQAASPWKLLNLQGQNNTLFVHASTCFESALDCWGYANMLLADGSTARQALPASKSAPIAILGAGVSGLLFAVQLKNLGYTNLHILESTDRFGGKTHTIKRNGPYPPGSTEPTYCELGTCYMSPAYDTMIADLKKYLNGNARIEFGNGNDGFRAIVTTGQLPPGFKAPLVMAYDQYVLRKAEAELKLTPGFFDDIEARMDLFVALTKYIALHIEIFGFASPMPSTPPQAFLDKHSSDTFEDFLRYHNLEAIIGILQYGYEVQGYGTITSIPAFYGLVWMTPPIVEAIIEDAFGGTEPIVTAWSKGWGDVWTQIVKIENLNITYNVTIDSIERSSSLASSATVQEDTHHA